MSEVNVVGLDLSLVSTGMASGHLIVVLKTPASKYSGMYRLSYIRDKALDFVHDSIMHSGNGRTLVAIEGYSSVLKGAALLLPELGGVIRLALWEHAIDYVDIPPSKLKKYATGKGNATKDEVLAAAVRRFPDLDITNNDQADAQWLYAMGRDGLDDPVVKMPEVNRQALRDVLWTPVEVPVGS